MQVAEQREALRLRRSRGGADTLAHRGGGQVGRHIGGMAARPPPLAYPTPVRGTGPFVCFKELWPLGSDRILGILGSVSEYLCGRKMIIGRPMQSDCPSIVKIARVTAVAVTDHDDDDVDMAAFALLMYGGGGDDSGGNTPHGACKCVHLSLGT
eukprot:gene11174-biopygen21376